MNVKCFPFQLSLKRNTVNITTEIFRSLKIYHTSGSWNDLNFLITLVKFHLVIYSTNISCAAEVGIGWALEIQILIRNIVSALVEVAVQCISQRYLDSPIPNTICKLKK